MSLGIHLLPQADKWLKGEEINNDHIKLAEDSNYLGRRFNCITIPWSFARFGVAHDVDGGNQLVDQIAAIT